MVERAAVPEISPRRRRLLSAARSLTTPLLPDDYLALLDPRWSTREATGRIVRIQPEPDGMATVVIEPRFPWPGHHGFPNMPSSRYGEIALRVKDICERYGLPYNTGPFLKQWLSVQRTLLRLAFPGGKERPKPGPYVTPPDLSIVPAPELAMASGLPAFP